MRNCGMVGILSLLAALSLGACGDDGGGDGGPGVDSGRDDGGGGVDSAVDDSGGGDAGDDSGGFDAAGVACGGTTFGECPAGSGLSCLCCPAGGPAEYCICTTECTSGSDCTDGARPTCDMPPMSMGGGPGLCRDDSFACAWGAVCAAADTAIATPSGDRPIAALASGDLVFSVDDGAIVAVPIARTSRTAVSAHHMVRVTLANGAVIEMSPGHPTADGRGFGELRAGDLLDSAEVTTVEVVPYPGSFTYDILPASDTGTYFASGTQVGSTLAAP